MVKRVYIEIFWKETHILYIAYSLRTNPPPKKKNEGKDTHTKNMDLKGTNCLSAPDVWASAKPKKKRVL